MNNITVVVGVRPHYIKAAGLNELFKGTTINPIFFDIHQHYDQNLRNIYVDSGKLLFMSNSKIKSTDGTFNTFLGQVSDVGRWLESDEGKKTKAVVVLGDANPALAGAIAANRLDFPLIHIEAGVRRSLSEKEHWNSLIADHLSLLRYCYTKKGVSNLEKEGLAENTYMVGDVLANWTIEKARRAEHSKYYNDYCLVSIHRPQNCNEEAIAALCDALQMLQKRIVWILHPRTISFEQYINKSLHVDLLRSQTHDNVLALIKFADMIITDSGGLVREGVLLSKPVVVCHEQGMWEDLVTNNAVARADMTKESLITAFKYCKNIDHESGRQFFMQENGISLFIESLTNFLNKV